MIKKRFLITLTAGLLSVSAAFPAMAGSWKNGTGENTARWWYDNGDQTWAANGWHWIDGNQDGISECYYFDAEGWLLTSATTPDGYTVDANGAWTVSGIVQTKQTSSTQTAENESWDDFQNSSSSSSRSSKKSGLKKVQPTTTTVSVPDSDTSDSDDIFNDSGKKHTSEASDTSSSSHSSNSGPSKEASSSSGDKKPEAPKKTKQEPGSGYRQGSVTDEEIANNTSSDSSEEAGE